MKKVRVIAGICFLTMFIMVLLSAGEARAASFYGTIVAIEGNAMQVKGSNGKVSVFWIGHKTHFNPRAPIPGDRVKIAYVKDKLKRRAVTHLAILGK